VDERWRQWIWFAGLAITGGPLIFDTARGALRGRFAADLVASFAVIAAFVLGQPLVGLVVVLMQSGGEALEKYAEGRATSALRILEDAAPRIVHRIDQGKVEDVAVGVVAIDDTILVRPGETVPCDGEIMSGESHLDVSTLTGEPVPLSGRQGTPVMSGAVNQEGALVIRVTALARESQYARIVALVREAQTSKAPLQRIADRYAVFFTPLTIAVCAVAYSISGDWNRVLAVLAIATPCPLILATPVAMLGGMSRSARSKILVRNGGALEALGSTTAVLFDKTGTITIGRPEVSRVIGLDSISEDGVLRYASAVEQGSSHLLARTLVSEAERRGQLAPPPDHVREEPGRGVEGDVEGHRVVVGASSFVTERDPRTRAAIAAVETEDGDESRLRAYVSVDGALAGAVEYADMIRPGMKDFIQKLRGDGVEHVMLLSGDRARNARATAEAVGIDEWRGELLPEDKVQVVKRLLHDGESVVMMGDGTNDAPALGTATVGVALASHGRGIATEAADVILLVDDPSRLLDAIAISRRTMRIARQSIWAGLGLSALGMLFAAAGRIPPVMGAAIQEAIDLAVILNALRAASGKLYGKS
jgi:heavy metal translocating P-type ATPase